MRWVVLAALAGCGGTPDDGGGGGAASPPCVWCAEAPPYARACRSTMVASGGQLVCVDDGEGRLCEAPERCGPPPP